MAAITAVPKRARRALSQKASTRLKMPAGRARTLVATTTVASCWICSMAMTREARAPAVKRRKNGRGRSRTRSHTALWSSDVPEPLMRARAT